MKSELDVREEYTKSLVEAIMQLPPDKAQKFSWMIQGAAAVSEGLKEAREKQEAVS